MKDTSTSMLPVGAKPPLTPGNAGQAFEKSLSKRGNAGEDSPAASSPASLILPLVKGPGEMALT